MIVGIDEVGRGSIAGPACVAVVALSTPITGLGDSKTIPAAKRRTLALEIKSKADFVGIGWATPREIEQYNIVGALKLAAERALLGAEGVTQILLDGNHNYLHDPRVLTIIKGDATEPSISAASIVAKVARDAYMQVMHRQFPQYGFVSHVGYATAAHRLAITQQGPCELHRMSFGFLKEMSL